MPITEGEWLSVRTMVEKVIKETIGQRQDFFVTGRVTKVDAKNKCIYMNEFGDQPIPIVGFEHEVTIYDETPKGTTAVAAGNPSPYQATKKVVKISVVMPKKGDVVFVAREMGIRRLPRCMGIIQGKNWIVPQGDD